MIQSGVSSWTENSVRKCMQWVDPSRASRRVIQEYLPVPPGNCWPLAGQSVIISVFHPVSITALTLGHLRKHQSPDGTKKSAPRVFSAYGMLTIGAEGTFLGTFLYDSQGREFQTFNLPYTNNSIFRYVKLRIEWNSGDQDFPCLYNFRVHGKLFT
ncbi:SUN domain-containing protein 3-like [Maylandia zebra]|uniref:SUN domain-containing protein 3-like n=1 Tax=Maylandia zebra TaxID=106582 RepID=UPI0006CF12BD|nr:SUN domain-containing protein 3-like [Maylandia zebra]